MPPPTPFAHLEPVERRATADVIAESLRQQLTNGRFEPGMQLTEAQLAEQLDVSRGPLREAFQRLVQEGLLVAEPHRGVFVAELGPDDVADVYVARAAIERAAARLVVARDDQPTVGRLARLVDDMARSAQGGGWDDIAEADLRFHETLVSGSGSPRLIRLYDTLLAETRVCLRSLGELHTDPDEVVAEHRAVLDAIEAGDADRAATCVGGHLERAAADHEARGA